MHATTILPILLVAVVSSAEILLLPNVQNATYGTEDTPTPPFVAEKIGEDASLTTYSVGCPPTETQYCPSYFKGYTYKLNPTSYNAAFTDHSPDGEGADFTMSMECTIPPVSTGTITTAVCSESYGGKEANFPGASTETYEYEGYLTYSLDGGSSPKSSSAPVTPTTTVGSKSTGVVATGSSGGVSASITSAPTKSAGDSGSSSGSASVGAQTTTTSTSGAMSLAAGGRCLVLAVVAGVMISIL